MYVRTYVHKYDKVECISLYLAAVPLNFNLSLVCTNLHAFAPSIEH